MRTGQVIGATNRLGEHATERPVTFQEVFATLYHNLGLNLVAPSASSISAAAPSGEAPPEIRQTLSRLRSPNAEEHGISHSTIVETAEAADGNEAFFVEFAVEDGAQRLGSRPVAEREQRIAHP
jgi:hypothetical protein